MRFLLGWLKKLTGNKNSAQKLYYQIAPRYLERKGGYLRIIKTGKMRKNDKADMAIVEFV